MCSSFFGNPTDVVKATGPGSRSPSPTGELLVTTAPPAGVT